MSTMSRARTRVPILPALAALVALLLLAAGPLANPSPAFAVVTDEAIEAEILSLINAARAERGTAPLRNRPSLEDLAGDRAAKMARTGVLKHPKCLPCKLDRRGISYTTYGEVIAWTYKPWGSKAARSIFNIWRNSPPHWARIMDPRYGRIGIGVALRSNGATYAAAVLTN